MAEETEAEVQWYDRLTAEQLDRFGQLVDSRVRLLGEHYSLAFRRVQEIEGAEKLWILGEV